MARIENNDIYIYQGDTLDITINLTDDDGNTYVLASGERVMFYIKKTYNSVVEALEPVEIDSEGTLHIDADKMNLLPSRKYVYEIRVEGDEIHTMLSGNFIVEPGIKPYLA